MAIFDTKLHDIDHIYPTFCLRWNKGVLEQRYDRQIMRDSRLIRVEHEWRVIPEAEEIDETKPTV